MEIVERLTDASATDESIQQLERQIGTRLPQDYRRFLLDTNGGRPEPSGFVFQMQNGPSDAAVRYFLTLDLREKLYSIRQRLSTYADRIPKGTLPIACDSFGNLVLLDLSARAPGSVYFWDHERESMEEPTWENISVVAPSFTTFVDRLE